MTDATVGFLLQNLKEILIYNADLIGGVEDNVRDLCEDLETLKGFIKEYTRRQHKNDILKGVLKQIRNVVNDAEDAIETFLVEASIRNNRSFLKKVFHVFDTPFKVRRAAKQIESVRERVKGIYSNKTKLGLEALQLQIEEESHRAPQERKSSPVVEEYEVIGFDEEAKAVIDMLTDATEELQTISIVGMGGLGKTTLAKKILHDPKIEYEFNIRAFVYVSQSYQRKEVFLRILRAVTQVTSDTYTMSDDMLAEMIQEQLRNRKYFFIMDDVCTRDAWDDIKIAFPYNDRSSRVLITSRNRSVALHANPRIQPYDLHFLTTDESRKLLRRKVFGEESCPFHLEEYESVIIQKCGGLPQAIVGTAGILINHSTASYWWRKVSETVNDSGSGDQSNDVLTLSYNNLPFHLKPCFLYLGVFPEDYEISAWKLMQLWISEGFIESDGEPSKEEVAENYLHDLVDRDLVTMGQRRSDGRIKTCRIRSSVRDFCKKESLEENIFQEITRFGSSVDSNPTMENYRRLCVNFSFSEYLLSEPSGSRVRSLVNFVKEGVVLDAERLSGITESFKLLRILEIRSIGFTSFPKELCDLVLLKYLCISGDFAVLPQEVSNLWNMQTLVVETSTQTIEVEADIWKLLHLRHFLITNASANILCPPPTITHTGRGNLQTISSISPESCRRELFDTNPRLKKLGVRGKLALLLENYSECNLFESLYKLDFLENLKLYNDDPSSKMRVIPHEHTFPKRLTKITLSNTMLDWMFMSTLGKLENLQVLKLKDNAFQGGWWETEDKGFRRLRVFVIGETDLVAWKASAHHFPVLRTLVLKNCSKLEAIPSGLAEISNLQKIELFYTSPSVVSSARKIQNLKIQLQAQESTKGSSFKLSIYPPEQ